MALTSWSRSRRRAKLRSSMFSKRSAGVGSQGMTSARRIGAPDAKNRGVLLDAAEQLMLEEGYAAVTSRRVAEKAALKPQLVHYYFRTMDDLFLAAFRRRAEEGLEVQAQVLQARQPLWALWTVLRRYGIDPAEVPALVWSVLMTSVSRVLVIEQALGMSAGHAETVEFVERYLYRLEGAPEGLPAHQLRSEQSTPLAPSFETTTAPSTTRAQ